MPAKIEVEKCEGCGECVEACATNCIEVVGQKAVVKEEECCECSGCLESCEKTAITMG